MFKFVNSDDIGSTPKRQQTQRACESCRKRKKRCHHTQSRDALKTPRREEEEPEISQVSPSSKRPRNYRHTEISRGSERSYDDSIIETRNGPAASRERDETPNIIEPGTGSAQEPERNASLGSRFIGDLSPESIFLAATSPNATRGVSLNDSVGVWLSSTLTKDAAQGTNGNVAEPPPSSLFYGSLSMVQRAIFPLLQQECLTTLPSPSRLSALCKLYFEKNHPIFPVIDEARFNSLPNDDSSRILLQQGICLAASKNPSARRFLVLGESDNILNLLEFGDKIVNTMRLSIELGLVSDKIVLIQAYALLSQFADSPDGGDLSSQYGISISFCLLSCSL
jgi:hypothetical protein